MSDMPPVCAQKRTVSRWLPRGDAATRAVPPGVTSLRGDTPEDGDDESDDDGGSETSPHSVRMSPPHRPGFTPPGEPHG
jgi:hypothetical protein